MAVTAGLNDVHGALVVGYYIGRHRIQPTTGDPGVATRASNTLYMLGTRVVPLEHEGYCFRTEL